MELTTHRLPLLRRITGVMLAVALLSGVIVTGDTLTTTQTASADALSGGASAVPSDTPDAPTNIGGGGQGGACDANPSASPDIYCGSVTFSSNGRCDVPRTTATGLPPITRSGLSTPTRDGWTSMANRARWATDPFTGQSVRYCPLGASWTDSVTFRDATTYRYTAGPIVRVAPRQTILAYSPTTQRAYSYTNETNFPVFIMTALQEIDRIVRTYTGRTVVYSNPIYRKVPQVIDKYCPTSIGTNESWPSIVGPYGNSATPWPVYDAPGQINPLTDIRKWVQRPLYSTIGNRLLSSPGTFARGNDTALSLVMNCGRLNYQLVPSNESCYYPQSSSTLTTGSRNICAFTPGNYVKDITPHEVRCQYVFYPDTFGSIARGTTEFLNCGRPADCSGSPRCTFDDGWAHVRCGEVGNARAGRAPDNYNFANCNPAAIRCVWGGGSNAPAILDPDGVQVRSGAQVLADGRQWTVTWPTLRVTGAPTPIQAQWTQFIVAENSQPIRPGTPVYGADQPVFGSTNAAGTGGSDLTQLPSGRGEAGWPRTLYMNFYGATSAATSAVTVGQGQLAQPIAVSRGSLVPYSVYAVYRFYINETVTGYNGQPITKPAPYTCVSGPATFYPVTGRVTG
jgi:hypothetical protein